MPGRPIIPEQPPQASIQHLLERPAAQRLREYRYRLGQSVVFGLPVVALQIWGVRLGGPEAQLWLTMMQALLAGWVMYVGAAGMLFEGILWLGRGRGTAALIVAGAALGLYGYSALATALLLFTGHAGFGPLLFHWSVMMIAAWSALQWARMRR